MAVPGQGQHTSLIVATTARVADLASLLAVGLVVVGRDVEAGGWAVALAALVAPVAFHLAGLYHVRLLDDAVEQTVRLPMAWAALLVLLSAILYLARWPGDLPRHHLLWWFGGGLALSAATRILIMGWLARLRRQGRLVRNLVIAGAGEHGRLLVEHFRRGGQGIRLIGLFDDRKDRVPDYVAGFPVLGSIDALVAFGRRHPIDLVVIALPWDAEARIAAWIDKLRALSCDLRLSPDLAGFRFGGRGITEIGGLALLNLHERPLAGAAWWVKAVEDRLVALFVLLLAAPVMLTIALMVKLDSRGPVFFRQRRYGFQGETIEVWKFRTMHDALCGPADAADPRQATRHDPRVTRVGRLLRRTSLDELPQFLNVLRGDMSIVGPRPHAVAHDERWSRMIDGYLARARVKPGITGWAQINGLRGETNVAGRLERRVQYDLYYIENWSLWFDLVIILRTLVVGFNHPNAY